jgi:hypothetical protein
MASKQLRREAFTLPILSSMLATRASSGRRIWLLLSPHLIASAPNLVNEFVLKTQIDPVPQVVDDIHNIRRGVEGEFPDMFYNHGARHTPSRTTHEISEQGEFLWS